MSFGDFLNSAGDFFRGVGNTVSNWWNTMTDTVSRYNQMTQNAKDFADGTTARQARNAQASAVVVPTMSAYDLLKDERAWSEAQAEKAYEREKYLSDTAIQRRVADYKAAGLNPFLAYSEGGASAGSVPMASAASLASAALTGYYTGRGQDISAALTERGQNLSFAESVISSAFGLASTAIRGTPTTTVNKSQEFYTGTYNRYR